jgi:phenylalanyl-tRNA synthetase beta chain
MSAAGLSVEREEKIGEHLEDIVIGQIIHKESHPNSDHLWVCKVAIGQKEPLQIVTGAQNINVGDIVPVVQSGGVLPDNTRIEATVLRGVQSSGMMCSAQELKIGDDHSGILILDATARVGESFAKFYGFPDVVFDVEITPNRGDLLSMVGIAREVSVLLNRPLRMPKLKSLSQEGGRQENALSVRIEDKRDCDRFSAIALKGNFGVATPFYIQQRLIRAGMRPISLLVDISNYVMLELGQPSHAYDAKQVLGNEFVVRRGYFEEEFVALDDTKLELDPHMLVVADSQKVLGLAGIMGGKYSGVGKDTETVFLEAAHFEGVLIRKTTMRTNLRSEASSRFEKRVDPTLTLIALERYYELISQITDVTVCSQVVDENHVSYQSRSVTLRSAKLKTYLGKDFALNYVENVLNNLGFETVDSTHAGEHGGWHITVEVPSWRLFDVSIEEDLIEEVARIYGYAHIKSSMPKGRIPSSVQNNKLELKKKVLTGLVALGWSEVLTYSFNSREQIELSGYEISRAVKVHNPLSEDQRFLRLSLLPHLLQLVSNNLQTNDELKLFECSRVYHQKLYATLPAELVNEELEKEYLSFVYSNKNVGVAEQLAEFSETLGLVFGMTKKKYRILQKREVIESFSCFKMFHPGRVAAIVIGDCPVGLFGQIHPRVMENLRINSSVIAAEIDGDLSELFTSEVPIFKHFSAFPCTEENLTFLVGKNVLIGPVIERLALVDERIKEIKLKDRYVKGEKEITSVTLKLVYQKMDGPISQNEAAEIRNELIRTLQDEFGYSVITEN